MMMSLSSAPNAVMMFFHQIVCEGPRRLDPFHLQGESLSLRRADNDR